MTFYAYLRRLLIPNTHSSKLVDNRDAPPPEQNLFLMPKSTATLVSYINNSYWHPNIVSSLGAMP